jgi:hypothetical protein
VGGSAATPPAGLLQRRTCLEYGRPLGDRKRESVVRNKREPLRQELTLVQSRRDLDKKKSPDGRGGVECKEALLAGPKQHNKSRHATWERSAGGNSAAASVGGHPKASAERSGVEDRVLAVSDDVVDVDKVCCVGPRLCCRADRGASGCGRRMEEPGPDRTIIVFDAIIHGGEG